MKKSKCEKENSCRLNKVGGQAVLEGVMMKAGDRTVTSCRKEDGTIFVNDSKFVSVRQKCKFLNIPILRGVVNFIEMMILSVKTLNVSADALGIEEEDGKTEKWLKKHLGIRLTDLIMVIGLVLGIALSLFLFMYLPTKVASLINLLVTNLSDGSLIIHPTLIAVIEGIVKVLIFLLYLFLVSLIPDIKRTFMYHGAEHKSIACFEAGAELTPEIAKNYKRFHPRCGTSFMFFMIAIGIIVGMFVRNIFTTLPDYAIAGIRLLILPLVVGVGYEFIRFAGKHDNIFTRILSAPGLWVQRITTKEPTEDMLEIAIISLKCALRDDFPEFKEFFDERSWEKCENAESTEPTEKITAEDSAVEIQADTEENSTDFKADMQDLAPLTEECKTTEGREENEI